MNVSRTMLEIRLYLDGLKDVPKDQWGSVVIKVDHENSLHLRMTNEGVKLTLIKEDEAG